MAGTRVRIRGELTQLVKVGVAAVGPRDRADQAGLQECGPLVHQASLAAHVVLIQKRKSRGLAQAGSRAGARVGTRVSPCTADRCESRWTSRAPGPPPPSPGRRRTPYRHRGSRSPGPRRTQRTLVLEGTGSGPTSDFTWNSGFPT